MDAGNEVPYDSFLYFLDERKAPSERLHLSSALSGCSDDKFPVDELKHLLVQLKPQII